MRIGDRVYVEYKGNGTIYAERGGQWVVRLDGQGPNEGFPIVHRGSLRELPQGEAPYLYMAFTEALIGREVGWLEWYDLSHELRHAWRAVADRAKGVMR